jgi:phospholipid transport system substrate-binding protein
MSRNPPRVVGMKSLSVITVFVLGFLSLVISAPAAISPLDMIRSTTDQALKVLSDASDRGQSPSQQQLEKMWEIVLPRFDMKEMSQRALGVNWEKLTEDQRKEFTPLFVELVKNTYTDTLKRYAMDAKFYFDQEHIEGDHAEVQTRILSPAQSDPFLVVYRLHQEGEAWLVYDVVAENVSLVQNYRNQFSRIMAKSSGAGLIDALKRKLAELKATEK